MNKKGLKVSQFNIRKADKIDSNQTFQEKKIGDQTPLNQSEDIKESDDDIFTYSESKQITAIRGLGES
jgi:hypothetical protein